MGRTHHVLDSADGRPLDQRLPVGSGRHEVATQENLDEPSQRFNTATTGGLIGMVAGKVKSRDEMLVVAAAVLSHWLHCLGVKYD